MRFLARGGAVIVALALTVAVGPHLYDRWRSHRLVEEGVGDPPVTVIDHGPLPGEVRESSGLAVSRAHPGVFWTNNDSGDEPRLYALDGSARLLGIVEVEGVRARDWEALDIGPCPTGSPGGAWCLYVADTGDNARRRTGSSILVIPEPDPATTVPVEPLRAVWFTYEDGPFDVESVSVTPTGDIVLATKGREPPMRVFRITAEQVERAAEAEEAYTLSPIARLPIEPSVLVGRMVTGGSIGPDGLVLALRTYTEVYFYEWPIVGEPTVAAPACFLGPLEPIGEAIAFAGDGRIYLTSETLGERRGHLLEIECEGVGASGSGEE